MKKSRLNDCVSELSQQRTLTGRALHLLFALMSFSFVALVVAVVVVVVVVGVVVVKGVVVVIVIVTVVVVIVVELFDAF